MKRFIIFSSVLILLVGGAFLLADREGIYVNLGPTEEITAVFRTEGREILYQGENGTWEPFVIRGVDLSASIPGHAASDYAPDYEDYSRWLGQIGEMGANTIRVFTIMDADFYEALYDYNTGNPQPLYLLQGLSVPDDANYGAGDVYQSEFEGLLLENGCAAVDVIHGNRTIDLGNHTGTGTYRWDVSPWTLGYLLGHEWDSGIIAYTNNSTQGSLSCQGTYFTTSPEASRFEVVMARLMDQITAYESDKYRQQRLISFINSVWDDPFAYTYIYNARYLTYNQVDMEHIIPTQELLSGTFASYRLQLNCPDFQNYLTDEQRAELGSLLDGLDGTDLYSGYLKLLSRYHTVPVAAVGFGFSSARGAILEGSEPMTEQEQGQALVGLWRDTRQADWVGGFVSTWQDVWERNSWNTVPFTYGYGVDPWQDVQTDGQCYGLMSFLWGEEGSVCQVDGDAGEWAGETPVWERNGLRLFMDYDDKYLYFYGEGFDPDTQVLYLPLDTTPKSGSTYADGYDLSFQQACDFLVIIDGRYNSRVEVQEYYEALWAIFSYETARVNAYTQEERRDRDSPVFRPVRMLVQSAEPQIQSTWSPEPTYETGKLRYGNADPDAADFDSLADFCFTENGVEIRIPWQLLNFSNPSEMMIHDDYYECYGVESFSINEMYVGAMLAGDDSRLRMSAFPLEGWGGTITYHERLKESYYILQDYWQSLQ